MAAFSHDPRDDCAHRTNSSCVSPPPPLPPPCASIKQQGKCTSNDVDCTWKGGLCQNPPPPPPPVPPAERTWTDPSEAPAVRAAKLLGFMATEEKLHLVSAAPACHRAVV